jgi:hypothetical protein
VVLDSSGLRGSRRFHSRETPVRTERRARPGLTLAELVVALWLSSLVTAIVVALIRTESGLAGHSADRAEVLEGGRTAAAVLSADLSALEPGADVYSVAPESLSIRVFRGIGIVCGFAGADPLVRFRGLRQPEPLKDSVLVLTARPRERADSLRDALPAPGACPAAPGEDVLRIRLATPPVERDLLAFFEPGSYYVSGAFRYRGQGGRQPVTADVFASSSRFAALGGGQTTALRGIELHLTPQVSSSYLRGTATGFSMRVSIPLRNQ